MANGVQLATAYISLNVRTDDIKKQVSSALNGVGSQGRQVGQSIGSKIADGIKSAMGMSSLSVSLFNPLEIAGVRWAMRAGAAIGSVLKKALVGAIGGIGLGSLLGVGGTLTAGLDRLKTIQRAQVQLSLRLPPEEIKRITKDIQDVVKGTPIALDEALQAVPRALSAGIKPGKELNQYIKDIADTAASTGGQAGFGQIDIIFSQILGKGKLMGEELMQLTENGVDLRNALKNAFNWDDKKLNAMVAKGKVGMKEIQQAVQTTWGQNGGLSKLMGNTFDGAIGNLKASVARLGANILDVIFGNPNNSDDPLRGAIDGVTALTGKLDNAGRWVAANKDEIRGYFNGAKETATSFANKVKDIIDWLGRARDKVVEVGNWFSTTWDKASTSVSNLTTKVKTKFDEIKTKISDIVDDLKGKFDGIFGPEGWFAQQFDKLGKLVDKVRGILGLGEATANAANPGTTPFNPGPMAPNRFGNYPGRAGLAPGTRLDGSDQKIVGSGPLAIPGAYIGDSAILSKVKPGQYVSEPGVGDLTQGIGDCTSAIEDLIAIIEGRSTAGRSMATGNADQWLTERGFIPTDKPVPGAFQVGFFNDPNAPGGGHMQATLPGGTKINWGDDAAAANKGVGNQGAWDDPRFNRHYYKKYAPGGGVRGAGTGTSDSIPAWLSNGEHVLTARDVQAMGGQQGVYAFRNALHRANGGAIPGFAPGGAVDPSVIQDAQDNLADLNNQMLVAQAQLNEVIQKGDATPSQLLQAQQQFAQSKRALDNAMADLPAIMSGQTPTDRSKQNSIYNLTDQLAVAQQSLAEQQASGEEIPYSQQLQSQYTVDQLTRERNQAIAATQAQGQGANYGQDFVRSLGFIPAAAGNTGVAGTSSLAGFINMGNSVVGGLIDTGTSLAQTAVSAAITTGLAGSSFGGGAAAAPIANAAASYGIQLAGNQGKRIASYWFQMAGIGADALMEQMNVFGMPRWLGYDYGNFMPQIGIQEAALSTIEKMGGDAITKMMGQRQPGVVVPDVPKPDAGVNMAASGPSAGATAYQDGKASAPVPAPPSGNIVGPNDPGFFNRGMIIDPNDPNGAGGGGGGGSWARGGAVGIYDNGGVLKPGQLAFNASRTPESILTKQQWNAMAANASTKSRDSAPLVQNLYAQDMQDAIRQLEKVKRRDMMQYAGRP